MNVIRNGHRLVSRVVIERLAHVWFVPVCKTLTINFLHNFLSFPMTTETRNSRIAIVQRAYVLHVSARRLRVCLEHERHNTVLLECFVNNARQCRVVPRIYRRQQVVHYLCVQAQRQNVPKP